MSPKSRVEEVLGIRISNRDFLKAATCAEGMGLTVNEKCEGVTIRILAEIFVKHQKEQSKGASRELQLLRIHKYITSIVSDRWGLVKEGVMFKGYCVMEDGTHMPPVNLDDATSAVRYAELQKGLFHEVKIIDSDDYIVLHFVNRECVFPKPNDLKR